MTKRVDKKETSIKHKKTKNNRSSLKESLSSNELRTEKMLIENFVSLQKVMATLSVKFDSLTKQISKLLELFEISAKTLAEKDHDAIKGNKNKKLIDKIDTLIEQNKIIARGLTLMHDKIPAQNPNYPPERPSQQTQQNQQPPMPKKSKFQVDMGGYQKSMSPTTKEFSTSPIPQE